MRPAAAFDAVTSRAVKSKTGWPKSIKWKRPAAVNPSLGTNCGLGWSCQLDTCSNRNLVGLRSLLTGRTSLSTPRCRGGPCPNLGQAAATFRPRYGSALPPRWREGAGVYGVRTMTRVVIDILLFSCLFAVVTGIVIAAANLLI